MAQKASPARSFSMAEPVRFLSLHTSLNWIITILQKLKLPHRLLSFWQPHIEFFDHHPLIAREYIKKERSESREEPPLRIGDAEIVMERMGMCCCSSEKKLKECMDSDEVVKCFEEEEPSLQEVKEAFCVFDVGGDGFVDAFALQRALFKLGEGMVAVEVCEEMIAVHDGNGDGRIDFNEFIKLMERSFC